MKISEELQRELDGIVFTDTHERKVFIGFKMKNPDKGIDFFRSERSKFDSIKTIPRPSFFTDGTISLQPPSAEDAISYNKEMNSFRF